MIRGLLVFLLILLAIHVGYMFASPVVKNTMLQGKMEDLVQSSGFKGEHGLRFDTMDFVHDKHIPLEEKDLVINIPDKGPATIAAHYSCDVTFWFYTRHYEFYPASSERASLELQRSSRQTLRHQSVGRPHSAGY